MMLAFAVVPLACLICAVLPGGVSAAEVLFDFEDSFLATKWTTEPGADAAISSEWASTGKSSLRLRFLGENPNEWPQLRLRRGDGVLPTGDFTAADQLLLTVRNPASSAGVLSVLIRDARGHEQKQRFDLAPLSEARLVLPFNRKATQPVSWDAVEEIVFYMRRSGRDQVVFIDDVRISNEAAERLADFDRRLEQVVADTQRLKPALESAPPAVAALLASLEDLRQRVQAAARDPQTTSSEQLDQLEDQVLRLESLPRVAGWLGQADVRERGFRLLTATAMTKIHLHAARLSEHVSPETTLHFDLARNEAESGQVVVVPVSGDLTRVRWRLQTPRNSEGESLSGSVRVVGYVRTQRPPYQVPFAGWWPDPLLEGVDQIDLVPLGEVLAIWITVHAKADARPGSYEGTLEVTADDRPPQNVAIHANVRSFALPTRSSLPVVMTVVNNNDYIQTIYPERDPIEVRTQIENLILDYRVSPANLYRVNQEGWSLLRLKEMIARGASVFAIGYLGFTEAHNTTLERFHELRQRESFPKWLETCELLSQAGWDGPTLITFYDEAPAKYLREMQVSYDLLREAFPPQVTVIPVGTLDPSLGGDWQSKHKPDRWVLMLDQFDRDADAIAAFRSRGGKPWVYTCLTAPHPYPMFFTEYDGIEPRLLGGAINWKLKVEGMLYYAAARWPVNKTPLKTIDGRRTDWNPSSYQAYNGCGSLMAAAPHGPIATIRLENLRDGLEDYEYYRLAEQASGQPVAVGGEVLSELRRWTTDPKVMLNERARLTRLIEQGSPGNK